MAISVRLYVLEESLLWTVGWVGEWVVVVVVAVVVVVDGCGGMVVVMMVVTVVVVVIFPYVRGEPGVS